MRSVTDKILDSQPMGSSFESEAIFLDQIYGFSFQAIYSGTPNGTFVLQASNQDVSFGKAVTEWTDISGSSYAVTSSGSTIWNYNGAFFRWVRVKYIYNSGSGSCSVTFTSKGV